MSIVEIHGGGDRRSMIKRYERKSKHDAIRELIDLVHCCWARIDVLEAQVPGAAELADRSGRSPKDYAIEHAEYMARCADHVSAAFDQYGLALINDDGDEADLQEAVSQATGALQESLTALRGYVYEFRKRSARALAAVQQDSSPGMPVAHDARADLQCWFGLSYASWLTMPRVLMEAMPGDWQSRIAPLLWEYSEAWDTGRLAAPYVLARNGNKFTAWPEWLLNYRHPDAAAINAVRATRCSCPSGDGSLRWPCAVHGTLPAQQGKEQGAGE